MYVCMHAYRSRNVDDTIFRLASPVISASVRDCAVHKLSNPVEVIFTHLPYDKVLNVD